MLSPPVGPAAERRLLKLYRSLSETDRASLSAFAEFLAQRDQIAVAEREPESPLLQPRPERESVVAAIKRLSKTYPMLDPAVLLNETSGLMSAHILQGRPAPEVIDELEALFDRHYAEYRSKLAPEG